MAEEARNVIAGKGETSQAEEKGNASDGGYAPALSEFAAALLAGRPLRFVDLFAGLGGTRIGVQQACASLSIPCECVLTADKKKSAARVYAANFGCSPEDVLNDVSALDAASLPDFDMLLGGFPCQPFSQAGSRRGFSDTRGTLFFDVARILDAKKPEWVLLENVENITRHDGGKTISRITEVLSELGYESDVEVMDASEHGCAQKRRRAFIVGCRHARPDLSSILASAPVVFDDLREHGKPTLDDAFTKRLLAAYDARSLEGAILLDKRSGEKTIHSWDFGMRGKVTKRQKEILTWLLENHRARRFAEELGVRWRDGMPLNLSQISRGMDIPEDELEPDIDRLLDMRYIVARHPYADDSLQPRTDLPIGYRIDTSRLNFELNRFLDGKAATHTLTATDADRCGVVDGDGVRRLTRRECLRLFGFPEWYEMPGDAANDKEAYDLIGNSICVPVVKKVASHLLSL